MTVERIFIIGGTGNIGKALVQDLIGRSAELTLYARNPAKLNSLFPKGNIKVVEGDLHNLDSFKEAIKGHTRLFFVISDFTLSIEHVKKSIATYAYEAGVKQIVDISTMAAGYPWKSSFVGDTHLQAEKAVSAIPNRGRFVALRPGRFMSNILTFDIIHPDGVIRDMYEPNASLGWVSPNDIAAVAATVLTDDIEKHGDSVYELIGDTVTSNQRAEFLSRLLEKKITYQQIAPVDKYNQFIKAKFPHVLAYSLTCYPVAATADEVVTKNFPILIGREAETLEEFATKNKEFL